MTALTSPGDIRQQCKPLSHRWAHTGLNKERPRDAGTPGADDQEREESSRGTKSNSIEISAS